MKLAEIKKALSAQVLVGDEWLEREASSACGADLMSDVLAFTKVKTLLLTGMTNVQVVRTAEMSDLVGIVFVRGKTPGPEVIELAKSHGLPLMTSQHKLYEACGILYTLGLKGCSEQEISCG